MEFASYFLAIKAFLSRYQKFWFQEIMNYYPGSLDFYPEEWLEVLGRFDSETLWQIDSRANYERVKGTELYDYLQTGLELSRQLPNYQGRFHPLPDWAFNKVKGKKRHEIDTIFDVIQGLKTQHGLSRTIDIGGGVGHLSRILGHYGGLQCFCIDCDAKLLMQGQKREQKYPVPEQGQRLSFVHWQVGQATDPELNLSELFDRGLILGLHTCGPLALKLMDHAHQSTCFGLFNFGCCYAKLDPVSEVNLSSLAKQNPMPLSTHGLTLATRSHSDLSYKSYLLKERVKSYRFGLHLFLYEHLNQTEFVSVGNYPLPQYWQPFSDYAQAKLAELGYKQHFDAKLLSDFYERPRVQALIKQMFLANLTRWQLGRLLEIYLLLDRSLYLQELGFEVSMKAYFEESISPRNIGILALK